MIGAIYLKKIKSIRCTRVYFGLFSFQRIRIISDCGLEGVGEILVRVHTRFLGCFYERINNCACLGTDRGVGKKEVFPANTVRPLAL